jgi:WD40 repeat protein
MRPQAGIETEWEERLQEAVLAYEQAVDAGRKPDAREFLERYPDVAGELAKFLADQDQLSPLIAPLRALAPPSAGLPRFPGYEVLEEVARGGMGVVYKARQISPPRIVAMKCIRDSHLAGSPAEVRRFLLEAENAARLDHPHIVPIYEVGEHEGQRFFSMKFIEGGSLAQAQPGPVRDQRAVARLLAVVARAVHHAHQRGILHRDLKPANILLDTRGQPHVTDFGLAKRVETAGGPSGDSVLTLPGVILGTANYMAPEQATAEKVLSTAVDIYGLGAILYQLLTGRPPFQGDNLLDVLLQARQAEPAPPRNLRPRVDRDLEAICLKCLEKQPSRRYGSAEALAVDLERFSDGRPITVRPAGALERAFKWAKRRPAVAALSAAVVLLAACGIGGIWLQSRRTADLYEKSQSNLYVSIIRQVKGELTAGQPLHADESLDSCPPELRQWEWHYLKRWTRPDVVTLQGHTQPVQAVQYSPDGSSLATTSLDGTVLLWDVEGGKQRLTLQVPGVGFTSVCFSGDGRTVITAGEDQVVRLWDAATGEELRQLPGAGDLVAADKGSRIATRNRQRVVAVWELDAKEPIFRLPPQQRAVEDVALSPNGRRLAVAGYGKLLDVWDLSSGREMPLTFPDRPFTNPTAVWSVAFSPDGSRIAAGSADVWEWNAEDGASLGPLSGSGDFVAYRIAYSPDGNRVAATDGHGRVRVWDRKTGRTVPGPKRQPDLKGAVFNPRSPEGRSLAVIRGKDVTIEDLNPPAPPSRKLEGHARGRVEALAFSPDERLLASRARDEVILWEVDSGRHVHKFHLREAGEASESNLAFSRDGRLLVSAGPGDRLWMWDVETGRECEAQEITGKDLRCAAFSHDGRLLSVAGGNGRISLRCWGDGTEERSWTTGAGELFALDFRPGDNRQLVSCSRDGGVQLWDTTGKEVRQYRGHSRTVTDAAFRPGDGRCLATASADGTVRVWDTDSGSLRHVLDHGNYVAGVAYSPDGRRLAACDSDGAVRLWDANSGQEMLILAGHNGWVSRVAFSPGGHLLASCSHDGTVRIWDARPLTDPATP